MHWIDKFDDLRLDIVGIIAVLGEQSITRNAQVTSLSWWSTLPRLMPAPHALLEHERKYRLPTAPGIVAGAYSGLVKREINFFAQLLHPEPLDDYQVELCQVCRKDIKAGERQPRSFGAKPFGPLFWISLAGAAMTIALIGLSIHYDDAFSLLSTVMLAMVSSFVGFSTHWSLVFKEPTVTVERQGAIPRSDVIIYYPNGSIRVIRPESEQIARLYFQTEHAQYVIDDTPYRTLALFSTVMFMAGVVSLANASNILQVAFAASYVLLNVAYCAVSALNPYTFHWSHAYDVEILPIEPLRKQGTDNPGPFGRVEELKKKLRHEWRRFEEAWILEKRRGRARKRAQTLFEPGARNFTSALWTAIVLTGTAGWLNEATAIAPVNEAWKEWLKEADGKVQPNFDEGDLPGRHNDEWGGRYSVQRTCRIRTGLRWTYTRATHSTAKSAAQQRRIMMKEWEYQQRLTAILAKHANQTRKPLEDEVVTPDASATDSDATQTPLKPEEV